MPNGSRPAVTLGFKARVPTDRNVSGKLKILRKGTQANAAK